MILAIEDRKLLRLLKWLLREHQSVQYAAKRPDIGWVADVHTRILIEHFGRPIHQCRISLEVLVLAGDKFRIWFLFPTEEEALVLRTAVIS